MRLKSADTPSVKEGISRGRGISRVASLFTSAGTMLLYPRRVSRLTPVSGFMVRFTSSPLRQITMSVA